MELRASLLIRGFPASKRSPVPLLNSTGCPDFAERQQTQYSAIVQRRPFRNPNWVAVRLFGESFLDAFE
jgi:hypothetical protein